MDLKTFYEAVEAHADLRGVGIDPGSDGREGAVVEHTPSGLTTRLPVEAIEAAEWEVIEPILLGEREPLALQHMTRVVGYYSRVENWNPSKIGELKDRHRGTYTLAETA